MPNIIAYLVLGLWPFVLWGIFRALPPGRALIWSVLASYLLLPSYPVAFDFPLIPAFDKTTIPNIMAIILAVTYSEQKITWLPRSKLGKILVFVFVFSPAPTVLTNGEPIVFVMDFIRGLYLQDIFAMTVVQSIILANFILARHLLTTEQDLRDLLLAIVMAGTAYSFPMLIEVRLSPQINIWVYGFFQHVFDQTMRGGGFRPMVFLSHGIWAAMLIMISLSSALILLKNSEGKLRKKLIYTALFLACVLVLCKTLSALLYAMFFAGMVLFIAPRVQIKVAVLLACLTLAYPIAKGANLVPEEKLLSMAERVSADRAQSLEFRFEHEGALLGRAQEKPLFGWGIWGRNQIHDPITGRIISVTDGRWVLTLGMMGWVGFLAEFGLLVLPIFLLLRVDMRAQDPKDWRTQQSKMMSFPLVKGRDMPGPSPISPIAASLALLLSINTVDLLPNATLTTMTWLIAGALLGYVEAFQRKAAKDEMTTHFGTRRPTLPIQSERPRTVI